MMRGWHVPEYWFCLLQVMALRSFALGELLAVAESRIIALFFGQGFVEALAAEGLVDILFAEHDQFAALAQAV